MEQASALIFDNLPGWILTGLSLELNPCGVQSIRVMRAFLKTLLDLKPIPTKLILINSGVRLTSEGSELLETLQALSDRGAGILSCGTCLDFYGLKDKLKVGIISNMYDIAQSLLEADRLIKP